MLGAPLSRALYSYSLSFDNSISNFLYLDFFLNFLIFNEYTVYVKPWHFTKNPQLLSLGKNLFTYFN